MKTTKQIFSFILSLFIALSIFSACGQSNGEIGSDGSDSGTEKSTTEATAKPAEPANVPDPDFYLNTAPDSTNGEYSVYCFKGNPTEAAQNYVSVLQDKYAMTLVDSYADGTTLGWHLQKDDDENADVDISVNCTGGINWELWISFGSSTRLSAAETWDKLIVPTISGPAIPSPDAFFDHKLARNEDFYNEDKGRYTISFKTDIDTGALAMEEYVSLLYDEKLKLELAFEEEETILYLKQHNFGFNYTGEEDVSEVIDDYKETQGDLLVYIQRNGQKGTSLLTLHFKPDAFEFIDFGDRTSYSPVDYSGKNTGSDNSGNGNGNNARQECNVCDGSGECTTCKGDGYLHSSASDKEDRNCYKCHPNYGDCPYCHGTGWRD